MFVFVGCVGLCFVVYLVVCTCLFGVDLVCLILLTWFVGLDASWFGLEFVDSGLGMVVALCLWVYLIVFLVWVRLCVCLVFISWFCCAVCVYLLIYLCFR